MVCGVCSIFVSVNVLVMFWFQWFFLFLLLLFLQDCTCETVCYVFICKHFDCELAYKWIWGWLLPFSQVIKILRLYIVFFTGILFYSLPSLGCTYSGCYRWLFWGCVSYWGMLCLRRSLQILLFWHIEKFIGFYTSDLGIYLEDSDALSYWQLV